MLQAQVTIRDVTVVNGYVPNDSVSLDVPGVIETDGNETAQGTKKSKNMQR